MVGTLTEILFPRTLGPVGQDLNGRTNLDFDGAEYAGWGTGKVDGRLKWVTDPSGSGRTVVRWELRYGDEAKDQYGPDGQRIELWKEDSIQYEGTEAWFAFSWFLGDGAKGDLFRYPSGWALLFQNHGVAEAASPAQALEVNARGEWVWDARKAGNDETGRRVIGQATRGHWHYFLLYTTFTSSSTGVQKVWHSVDLPPDPSSTPSDSRTQNTIIEKPTRATLHMYRAPKGPEEYPWVAYTGPFARAATSARAIQLAGWTTAAPSPTPAPPSTVPLSEVMTLCQAEIKYLRALPRPVSWDRIKASPVGVFYYGHGGK